VSSISQQCQAEKEKVAQMTSNEEKLKKMVTQYEQKLQDMDVLLEELDRKEQELAEMKVENEACLEYETMVEEMAQEILKKEEEAEENEKKIRGLEDILAIQEGYTENLEAYNQELNEEVAEKEAEFSQVEAQRVEDEDLLLDLEEENGKYREKVQSQTKQIKELTEQLEAYTSNSDEKN
jgi:chromosome segregation ATPase